MDDLKIVKREIQIQKKLDHPNIVKLHNYIYKNNFVYIILEYAENGNMFQYLQKNSMGNFEIGKIFLQICEAVKMMHSLNLIHRDIKPENILLDKNLVPKLSDFGWSVLISKNNHRKTFCGTFEYMAPEILENEQYDYSVDIWSLGILLYEFLQGKSPFEGDSIIKIYQKIVEKKIELSMDINPYAVDLIFRCLKKNPEERLDIDQVLRSPYLMEIRSQIIFSNNLDSEKKLSSITSNRSGEHSQLDYFVKNKPSDNYYPPNDSKFTFNSHLVLNQSKNKQFCENDFEVDCLDDSHPDFENFKQLRKQYEDSKNKKFLDKSRKKNQKNSKSKVIKNKSKFKFDSKRKISEFEIISKRKQNNMSLNGEIVKNKITKIKSMRNFPEDVFQNNYDFNKNQKKEFIHKTPNFDKDKRKSDIIRTNQDGYKTEKFQTNRHPDKSKNKCKKILTDKIKKLEKSKIIKTEPQDTNINSRKNTNQKFISVFNFNQTRLHQDHKKTDYFFNKNKSNILKKIDFGSQNDKKISLLDVKNRPNVYENLSKQNSAKNLKKKSTKKKKNDSNTSKLQKSQKIENSLVIEESTPKNYVINLLKNPQLKKRKLKKTLKKESTISENTSYNLANLSKIFIKERNHKYFFEKK